MNTWRPRRLCRPRRRSGRRTSGPRSRPTARVASRRSCAGIRGLGKARGEAGRGRPSDGWVTVGEDTVHPRAYDRAMSDEEGSPPPNALSRSTGRRASGTGTPNGGHGSGRQSGAAESRPPSGRRRSWSPRSVRCWSRSWARSTSGRAARGLGVHRLGSRRVDRVGRGPRRRRPRPTGLVVRGPRGRIDRRRVRPALGLVARRGRRPRPVRLPRRTVRAHRLPQHRRGGRRRLAAGALTAAMSSNVRAIIVIVLVTAASRR